MSYTKTIEQLISMLFYHKFDINELQKVANASAEALGVHIYGGDAIVSKDGSFHIIDLNDWPSFAPCREEAASFIAQSIVQQFSR